MSFETAVYLALGCAVLLLIVGVFLIAEGREKAPPGSVADELLMADETERRDTHKHFLRMLLGLNALEDRYVQFTTRALVGFAILGAATIFGLATNAYLLHRVTDVSHENQRAVLGLCADIEALKRGIHGVIVRFPESRPQARVFRPQRCPHIKRLR